MPEPPKMTFDLLQEPCVPVLDLRGKPLTLSLRETLLQAHNLREIHVNSPLVTAALVRLFVAILTDIHPYKNHSEWAKIWSGKKFDESIVEAYLTTNAGRFDLFHPLFPFYQCAALEDDFPINLNLLASELSTGNNPTLFDHSLDTIEKDYSPAEAFHLLLSTQSFALAGLLRRTTRLKGETDPLYWQSAYGGALIPGAMIWLSGDNLFETLCLNLAPLSPLQKENDEDLSESERDKPIWRQDKPESLRDRQGKKGIEKTAPLGTRDRLTFQSRLIRLLPVKVGEKTVVRRAAFNHGRSLNANAQNSFDPMLAYRPSKKEGWLVTRLSPERSLWRDAHSVLGQNDRPGGKLERVTPRALHLLHDSLSREIPGLDKSRLVRLNVAGVANDQAKILLWRHDRMDAPAQAFCDPEIAERVKFLLADAEGVASALREATRRLCAIYIAPLALDPKGKMNELALKADPDRVSALADAVDTRPTYWARLESEFHTLLLSLVEDQEKAANAWKDKVKKEAENAYEEVIESLGDNCEVWKASSLINAYFAVPSRQTKPIGKKTKQA